MVDMWQQAFSDEVRAELGRQGKSAASAARAIGISTTAWQLYFKKLSRDIPSRVMLDLAKHLQVPLSELTVRAERRERELLASLDAGDLEVLEGASPAVVDAIAEGSKARPKDGKRPRRKRAAGE